MVALLAVSELLNSRRELPVVQFLSDAPIATSLVRLAQTHDDESASVPLSRVRPSFVVVRPIAPPRRDVKVAQVNRLGLVLDWGVGYS